MAGGCLIELTANTGFDSTCNLGFKKTVNCVENRVLLCPEARVGRRGVCRLFISR